MALYKRGHVWWFSYWYQGKQVFKSTGSRDKGQAKRIYLKVRYEVSEGRWFNKKPEHTFGELMTKYLEEKSSKRGLKGFFQNYAKSLKSFFGEDILISQITPPMVHAYKIERRGEGLQAGTINRGLTVLKGAFNFSIKNLEWLDQNPVTKIPMEQEPPGRVRFLKEEEFKKLFESLPEWLKPVVMVAENTGLRRENILSLKWDQVDLEKRVINLDHTEMKNGQRLSVPLNDTMISLFQSLPRRSEYVFCHTNGRRYRELKKGFGKALVKAGIEDFKFHDLRHTFASNLVQRGINLYVIQRLLGHKDGKMTQRYSHLSNENLKEAVLKLDQ